PASSPPSVPAAGRRLIVRHGVMRFLGTFDVEDALPCRRGDEGVTRTERRLGNGQGLCDASPRGVELLREPTSGRILRRLTAEDQLQIERLHTAERAEFETCQRFVSQRRLQMDLVDVEHLFGGERIIFYFLAEKRVDFRELVKDLARQYQTRIEMRQI